MILDLPYTCRGIKWKPYLLIDKSSNMAVIWSDPEGMHIDGYIEKDEEKIKFVKQHGGVVTVKVANDIFAYPIEEIYQDIYISKNNKFIFDVLNNRIFYVIKSEYTEHIDVIEIGLNDFLLFRENIIAINSEMITENITDNITISFEKKRGIRLIIRSIIKHFYEMYSYKNVVILKTGNHFYIKKDIFSPKAIKFEIEDSEEESIYNFESFIKYFFDDIIENKDIKERIEKWFDIKIERKLGINFVFEKKKAYGWIKYDDDLIYDYHLTYRTNAYFIIEKIILKQIIKGLKDKIKNIEINKIANKLRKLDINELKNLCENIIITFNDSIEAGNCKFGTQKFVSEVLKTNDFDNIENLKITIPELIDLVLKNAPKYLKNIDFLRTISKKLIDENKQNLIYDKILNNKRIILK